MGERSERPTSPVIDQARALIAEEQELDRSRDTTPRRATSVAPAAMPAVAPSRDRGPVPVPVLRDDHRATDAATPAPAGPGQTERSGPARADSTAPSGRRTPSRDRTGPATAAPDAGHGTPRTAVGDPAALQQLTANVHAECAEALDQHERQLRDQGVRQSRGAIILEAVASHHEDLPGLGVPSHRRDDLFPGEQLRYQRATGPDRRSLSFYIRRSSRETLDRLADEHFGGNRSALVEAALRRYLGLPDLPTG